MSANTTPEVNTASEPAPDTLPVPLDAPGVVGVLEQIKHGSFVGWLSFADTFDNVGISLFEGERCLATVSAGMWREDIARKREGKGYCGFEITIPEVLCDGRLYELDFQITGTTQSLLARPLRVLPGRRPREKMAVNHAIDAQTGTDGNDAAGTASIKLSIIVNFYNMHREAARTLTSLARNYQQGIGDLSYEVLCVDNGSDPPMDPDWVASFGPEFRLFKPSQLLPSPCFAINEAAQQARGEYLAVMIDGAHVLTPGVFAEAMAAFAESPSAIVAVRYWFVGGDQRWLAAAGYSREMEDKIFARIYWPVNGYGLFATGAPLLESPTTWLDGLFESNCLFLKSTLYRRIGGMDEDFSEPGGGFANLDMLRRAAAGSADGVISLIGEASFHQYHGGTTTNVDDSEKDARVRAYASSYRELRGGEFKHLDRKQMRYRGSIKSDEAIRSMKNSYLPLGLAVTDQVRPGRTYLHYDAGAQRYLQATYVECGLHRLATWRGEPVGIAPTDLLNLQEIVRQLKPDCIVSTSTDNGLYRFLNDVLNMFGCDKTRIVRVNTAAPPGAALPRVTTIVGKHDAPATLARIDSEVVACDTMLVLYAPAAGVAHPLETMHAYSKFVSNGSYLIFLGTAFGQPWLGYSRNWYLASIFKFVAASSFRIEPAWERQLLSTCASGYLRRVDEPGKYDASLDQLDIFENSTP